MFNCANPRMFFDCSSGGGGGGGLFLGIGGSPSTSDGS